MAYTKFVVAAAALAATVVAAPPEVMVPPATPSPVSKLQFGHKGGNWMGDHHYPPKPASLTAASTATKTDTQAKPVSRRDTGEWVNLSNDQNWDSANIYDGIGDGSDSYHLYLGDGTTAAGWPAKSQWVSFDNMFNNNKDYMFAACGQYNMPDDSGPEVGAIWDGIQAAAQASGVDHRLILAVILQESGGCVRAPTSTGYWANPGLMQDADGSATCWWSQTDYANPCPSASIYQMITDGTQGTAQGDGLANCINNSGWNDDQADFYRAARIYNSGSVSSTGNLQSGVATHCYASDIANRLTGWVWAQSECTCDSNPSSCGVVTY